MKRKGKGAKKDKTRRDELELMTHELGMAFSVITAWQAWLARTVDGDQLDDVEQMVRESAQAIADFEGVLYPARDRRGIGFVVWNIARRALLAAPPGTKKLVMRTRYEVKLPGVAEVDFIGHTKAQALRGLDVWKGEPGLKVYRVTRLEAEVEL